MVKKQKLIITNRREAIISLALTVVFLVLLNIVAGFYYFRYDLTTEKRYSILKPTKEMVRDLKDVVTIKVYLDGNLDAGYTRLKEATRNLLKELRAYGGKNIEYEFIDITAIQDIEERKAAARDLAEKGIVPIIYSPPSKTEFKEQIIFPGAIVTYAGRQMPVQLLDSAEAPKARDIIFNPEVELAYLNHCEIQLEYKFANAIQKLTQHSFPEVAFVHGHDELRPIETADLRETLKGKDMQFTVKDINLPDVYFIPKDIAVLIVAKPRMGFDEKDKYKIDQYIMHGGKVIWLVDGTNATMDSLQATGSQFVLGNDNIFNLEDMLFKYGVRINVDLVQDIDKCNPITLMMPGNPPQPRLFPWYYFPILVSDNSNPIVKNIDPVASYFPSSIDTIRNPGVTKTILLHTTAYAKKQLTPGRVHFGILMSKPDVTYYNQSNVPIAVLLEGKFESVYKNRMAPEFLAASDTIPNLKFVDESKPSKMIVISNGDIIRNEITPDGSFYPLGSYRFSEQLYGNKDFILNCIQYLIDDRGILETRNKEIKLRLLNTTEIERSKLKWQLINILLPILLIVLFGIGFNVYRKRKYAR